MYLAWVRVAHGFDHSFLRRPAPYGRSDVCVCGVDRKIEHCSDKMWREASKQGRKEGRKEGRQAGRQTGIWVILTYSTVADTDQQTKMQAMKPTGSMQPHLW